MLTSRFIQLLGTFAIGSLAAPTTTRFASIEGLEKRQNVTSLIDYLPSAEIHTSSWPQWAEETQRWSTYSAPTFDLIFIPKDEQEISAALGFLSSHDFPYFTQGGGHGYSPTLVAVQDAVMIKMEKFNEIQFHDDQTVTVGGAVRFGDLILALYEAERELTVGSCVCVGSTGAMLGGGHGRLQGKHGLTSDALRSIRMVLWNGTIVEASETTNSDLFWGMRGAGHNFGVVIESTYETFPQENDGMHYNADMVFTGDSLEGVINVINSIIPDQDPALALDFLFFTDPSSMSPVVFLNLVYAGPEAKGQQYADLFASTGQNGTSNSTCNISRLSIDASVVSFGDLDNVAAGGTITAACAPGSRQNTYSTNLRALDVYAVQNLFDSYASFIQAQPLAVSSLVLFEVFGQQGVDASPDYYTAYPNRGFSNVLALIEMIYTDDAVADAADTWAREWREALMSPGVSGYSQQHVYENYAHGDEPLEAIYGYDEWRKERLTNLKRQFDPKDNFNGYHNIPLEGIW